ncbi:MAG: AbrB/MazE/SpoVT family DNA-binding domain-containing protein [Gemmatimonadota bacterium]
MKARIVRIGNSRGIRLPKPLLEEAGLGEEVELRASEGSILISPASGSRAGWAKAAQQLRERGEDQLLDVGSPTRFDQEDWRW